MVSMKRCPAVFCGLPYAGISQCSASFENHPCQFQQLPQTLKRHEPTL